MIFVTRPGGALRTASERPDASDRMLGMGKRVRAGGRTMGVLSLALALGACGLLGVTEPAEAEQKKAAAISNDWPATPVSAFRPSQGGVCPESYSLTQNTCVHAAIRSRLSRAVLEQKLAAYRAGAASPRVGGGPAPVELPDPMAAPDLNDPSNLPPDAFTKKRLDSESVKKARLQELDTLIRNARIRAGETVDGDLPATSDGPNPLWNPGARTHADNGKLTEMTQGLPPDVLRAVLVEIERNGGTALVSLEEMQALEAQAKQAGK